MHARLLFHVEVELAALMPWPVVVDSNRPLHAAEWILAIRLTLKSEAAEN